MKKIKEVLIQRASSIRKQELAALQESSCKNRNRKRFCIALKRKMRATKMAPALRHIKVELSLEQKIEVTAFRYYGHANTGYAICPNCGYALEREYQKHCDQCGQLLGWKKFIRDEVTVQRITGAKTQRENAIRPKKMPKSERTPLYTRPPRKHVLSFN